jgi:IS30 family transposase
VARSATVLVISKEPPFNSVRDMVNFTRSDHGREMSMHKELSKRTGIEVYFNALHPRGRVVQTST